ncbi:uncharacterized protein LOC101853302 [Aplysia californica]|uniref:Uncharacterized protein LOC101853302 n=1 Tax=Aplysia californica TaxID=6500 RepID=A0ABM0JJC8_APLCA|nr:uncharacterized protein LOC101853302 [Aplysia californica]
MSFKAPAEFDKVQYDPGVSLTNKSQVYFIQVPKGFDIKKLDGTNFSTHHKNEVGKEDGPSDLLRTVYGLTPHKSKDLGIQPLIFSEGKVHTGGKVKGLLSVTKSYEANSSPAQQMLQLPGRVPVLMPEGLKTRFTPFGAGSPVKMPVGKTKKKSHKRELDASGNSPDVHRKKRRKLNGGDDAIGDTPSPQKHKKHKHKARNDIDVKDDPETGAKITDMDCSRVSVDSLSDSMSSSKKKRKKFNLVTGESDDSGMDLKNMFVDSDVSCSGTGDGQIPAKVKKSLGTGKSPLKNAEFIARNGDEDSPSFNLTQPDEDVQTKKKKKSHSRSKSVDVNASVIEGLQDSSTKKKKKKKDKRIDLTLP